MKERGVAHKNLSWKLLNDPEDVVPSHFLLRGMKTKETSFRMRAAFLPPSNPLIDTISSMVRPRWHRTVVEAVYSSLKGGWMLEPNNEMGGSQAKDAVDKRRARGESGY